MVGGERVQLPATIVFVKVKEVPKAREGAVRKVVQVKGRALGRVFDMLVLLRSEGTVTDFRGRPS
jgi:hypothetical protein